MKKKITLDFLNSKRNLTSIGKLDNIYSNVIIDSKTSVIYDSNFEIIDETLYEVLYWGANIPGKWCKVIPGSILNDPEKLQQEIDLRKKIILDELKELKATNNLDIVELEASRYFFALHPTGWYPYGHLHDSLNRLFPWRFLQKSRNDKLLVSHTNKVKDFNQHCNAYGFDESSILECQKISRFIKVSTLYYGVNPSFYTSFTPECYDWVSSGYARELYIEKKNIPGIYLDRNTVKNNARGVTNNNELKSFLLSKGFTIVNGSEPLKTIYDLFSSAEYIIGSHGSLFANTIFCNEKAKIYEFCPATREDHSFETKYKKANDYNYYLIDCDDNFNIEIDLNLIKRILR